MKYIFALFLLTPFALQGQQITITGQITNSQNNPIGLATIDVVGKNIGNTSDDSGIFQIKLFDNIKKGDIIVLRVSKPGYRTFNKQISVSYLSIPIKLVKLKNYHPPGSPVANKEKEIKPPPLQDNLGKPQISVTSNFQSGGITANQVNIGSISRRLDADLSSQLVNNLPRKGERISINSVFGDSESLRFAKEIFDFLRNNGYKNVEGINQIAFMTPVIGQFLDRDSTGVKILIGSKQ